MNIKIYLHQNQKSTLDIQASLNYHEEKERNGVVIEDVYKGKLVWSITEKGENGKVGYNEGRKKYLKALMDKSTAKILSHSILNDLFISRFGSKGLTVYGGIERIKGVTYDKQINIQALLNENTQTIAYYIVKICEGNGSTANGQMQREEENNFAVQGWLPYEEALKMSIEMMHFIQTEELKYTLQGKPLYTIMYGKEGKPLEVLEPFEKEYIEKREVTDEEYIIPIKGPFQGKKLSQLTDRELGMIMDKAQSSPNKTIQELYEYAAKEAKKRMGTAL